MKVQLLTKESRRTRERLNLLCSVCGDKPAMYEVSEERWTHIVCESCKRLTLIVVANVAVGRSHS